MLGSLNIFSAPRHMAFTTKIVARSFSVSGVCRAFCFGRRAGTFFIDLAHASFGQFNRGWPGKVAVGGWPGAFMGKPVCGIDLFPYRRRTVPSPLPDHEKAGYPSHYAGLRSRLRFHWRRGHAPVYGAIAFRIGHPHRRRLLPYQIACGSCLRLLVSISA